MVAYCEIYPHHTPVTFLAQMLNNVFQNVDHFILIRKSWNYVYRMWQNKALKIVSGKNISEEK